MNLETITIRELERLIDSHDCHNDPDDGCDCIEAREELRKRYMAEKDFVSTSPK